MTNHKGDTLHRFYIAPVRRDRRHQLYSVTFEGKTIITETHLPSAHGCRWLAEHGYTGRAEMYDHDRPHPRMVFPDLVKAGRMAVKEDGSPRAIIERTTAGGHIQEPSEVGTMEDGWETYRLCSAA